MVKRSEVYARYIAKMQEDNDRLRAEIENPEKTKAEADAKVEEISRDVTEIFARCFLKKEGVVEKAEHADAPSERPLVAELVSLA